MQVNFVIHHRDVSHSIAQAQLAFEAGADGIFLISHDGRDFEVLKVARSLRKSNLLGFGKKRLKIGVNYLSMDAPNAYNSANGLDMVWMDNVGIVGGVASDLTDDLGINDEVTHWRDRPKIFGSVSFKYQSNDPNPTASALKAIIFGFIPTTSGSGTGRAPDVEKIKSMGMACDRQLAIASGLTAENLPSFAPYISHALVATGISSDEHTIDFELACRFVAVARTSSAAAETGGHS